MFAKLFTAALCGIVVDARRARELDTSVDCDSHCFVDVQTETRYATAELLDTNPNDQARYPTNGRLSMYQIKTRTIYRRLSDQKGKCDPSCKTQTNIEKLRLIGTAFNLSPGSHGFHVHSYGDLTSGCGGAGGHYNPLGRDHGRWDDPVNKRHIGCLQSLGGDPGTCALGALCNCDIFDSDLTEAEVTACKNAQFAWGYALYNYEDPLASLYGNNQINGRAIVIHNGEDDEGDGGEPCSKANGCAGPRIGCGVIVTTPDFVPLPTFSSIDPRSWPPTPPV